jgi:SagB-type dehydrogenase family enzyme
VQTLHTPLEELLERRSSVREFNGEPLSREEILRLAWTIYGRIGRSDQFVQNTTIGFGTVPSGGALYPLELFVFVLKESPSLERGIYQFGQEGITQKSPIEKEELLRAFLDDDSVFENAAVIFVLVCDFWQTVQKYSNRGYRFAMIETGHAAQNAYLWCAEQSFGVVEIGGFNDKLLADLLGLSYPKQAPITTLLVGRRKPNEGATS